MSPRQPFVALVLSLLWPGLGHVYQGRALRGVAWFLACLPAMFVLLLPEARPFGLLGAAVFFACAADAWRLCARPRAALRAPQ